MTIRQALPDDYEQIHHLVREAFKTGLLPPDNEESYVLDLRKRPTFVPELELVAEREGECIGHMMLTKFSVQEHESLWLSILCVKLEHRSQGIGAKLVEAGFERARRLGYASVFLLGYPNYYRKFGFKEVGEFGLGNQSGFPDEFVLGCELFPEGLSHVQGDVGTIE